MTKRPGGGVDIYETAAHYAVDDGRTFRVSCFTNDLTGASFHYLRILTGADHSPHAQVRVAVEGTSLVQFWEDSTISAAGTAQAIIGLNRQITGVVHTITAFINTAAQVATTGTSLEAELIPGGSGVGGAGFGGISSGKDIILDTSSTYLVSIQNLTASTIGASVIVDFHFD